MAKQLFFVAFFFVLAIVSVDLLVNVYADPHDLVEGMMEGSAHLAKGAVDTALAGGQMMEGMVDKGAHPFSKGLFAKHDEGADSGAGAGGAGADSGAGAGGAGAGAGAGGPSESGSGSASGSGSGSASASGSGSGSASASGSASGSGSGSGSGGSGLGMGPGLLRR